MTDLIGRVCAAICCGYHGECVEDGSPYCTAKEKDIEARATVAAVFDWLDEPGGAAFEAMARCGNQRDVFAAMLAAKRKEALGDE